MLFKAALFLAIPFTMVSCDHSQLPVVLTPDSHAGIHDTGYENAWVQYVEEDSVQVQLAESRTVIVFRTHPDSVARFKTGWIVPVTFDCGEKKSGRCDLSKPYKLYVATLLVEPVKVKKRS